MFVPTVYCLPSAVYCLLLPRVATHVHTSDVYVPTAPDDQMDYISDVRREIGRRFRLIAADL